MTLWARSLRPKPASSPSAPPRWTWKPSTWLPASSITSMPLRPMSAVWMRAHELGQPLTLTVIGVSSSGTRCSSSSIEVRGAVLGVDDRELAVLDAGARHRVAAPLRRARVAGRSRRARRRATRPCPRRRRARAASASASCVRGRCRAPRRCRRPGASSVPEMRPTVGGGADEELAVRLAEHADVVGGVSGASGASRSISVRPRYSVSSTSRNFSTPQSAIRNLRRARVRRRR